MADNFELNSSKSVDDTSSETIDYSFNALDSELMHYEWVIPKGYSAEIKGNKIVIDKKL